MKHKTKLFFSLMLVGLSLTSQIVNSNEKNSKDSLTISRIPKPYPSVIMKYMIIGTELEFKSDTPNLDLYVGINDDSSATQPDSWTKSSILPLDYYGQVKVFAKSQKTINGRVVVSPYYTQIVNVQDAFPGPAPSSSEDSHEEALYKDNSRILSWASQVIEYNPGLDVSSSWQVPDSALGIAEGTSYNIVPLGDGGTITLSFESSIYNGSGDDFLVFENGFSNTYLELAYVEVSTDGENFVRFDNNSLTENFIYYYGANLDTSLIYGLGGKYRQGWGTPFDLSYLSHKSEVISGLVDLYEINYVRISDSVGCDPNVTDDTNYASCKYNNRDYTLGENYPYNDSFGNQIFDPQPTYLGTSNPSCGFDLDAVGVINQI